MVIIGGIVGAVLGFAIGALFTEVVFANTKSWPDAVPFALAVAGVLVGTSLARTLRQRRVQR